MAPNVSEDRDADPAKPRAASRSPRASTCSSSAISNQLELSRRSTTPSTPGASTRFRCAGRRPDPELVQARGGMHAAAGQQCYREARVTAQRKPRAGTRRRGVVDRQRQLELGADSPSPAGRSPRRSRAAAALRGRVRSSGYIGACTMRRQQPHRGLVDRVVLDQHLEEQEPCGGCKRARRSRRRNSPVHVRRRRETSSAGT